MVSKRYIRSPQNATDAAENVDNEVGCRASNQYETQLGDCNNQNEETKHLGLDPNSNVQPPQGSQNLVTTTERMGGSRNIYPNETGNDRCVRLLNKDHREILRKKQMWIDESELLLGRIIGKGCFGLVDDAVYHRGSLPEMRVAVKRINLDEGIWGIEYYYTTTEPAAVQAATELVEEAMCNVDLNHPNVLSLVGLSFSTSAGAPLLVLPYMDMVLRNYLIYPENIDITVIRKLLFSLDVAKGMNYLCSKNIVHRDLATRNCMMNEALTVKVSDFGLSRGLYEGGYYSQQTTRPQPTRWMAMESLSEGRYDSKSDVWSFGVTMWEIFSRGRTPFCGESNAVLSTLIQTGQRNLRNYQPALCPADVFDFMKTCWKSEPNSRPTFHDLVESIDTAIQVHQEKSTEG